MESLRRDYYFFRLKCNYITRVIIPVIAKVITYDEAGALRMFKGMNEATEDQLFRFAMTRFLGEDAPEVTGWTNTEGTVGSRWEPCDGFPGNMVKMLEGFEDGNESLKEILLEENGVLLRGWA